MRPSEMRILVPFKYSRTFFKLSSFVCADIKMDSVLNLEAKERHCHVSLSSPEIRGTPRKSDVIRGQCLTSRRSEAGVVKKREALVR